MTEYYFIELFTFATQNSSRIFRLFLNIVSWKEKVIYDKVMKPFFRISIFLDKIATTEVTKSVNSANFSA